MKELANTTQVFVALALGYAVSASFGDKTLGQLSPSEWMACGLIVANYFLSFPRD
jgi:hypothetical protein